MTDVCVSVVIMARDIGAREQCVAAAAAAADVIHHLV